MFFNVARIGFFMFRMLSFDVPMELCNRTVETLVLLFRKLCRKYAENFLKQNIFKFVLHFSYKKLGIMHV
jgi:hypothetical protein